jgi:carbon storage regulator CsrA
MLVLSRKTQQQIQIGPHVTITILKVKGETVRIGIDAPADVCVLRSEVAAKFVGGPSADSQTEATVQSALAATERERTRSARIASGKPPVARRTPRVGFSSSSFVMGRSTLHPHLAHRVPSGASSAFAGGLPRNESPSPAPAPRGSLEMLTR